MTGTEIDATGLLGLTARISVGRIADEAPTSLDLLRLLAFLAPDDIPRFVLLDGADALRGVEPNPLATPLALTDAMGPLVRYGLVQGHGTTVSVHRSVQAAVRDLIEQPSRVTWALATCRVVLPSLPETVSWRDWSRLSKVVPHAMSALAHIDALGERHPDTIELDTRLARYLLDQGNLTIARERMDRCLEAAARTEPRLHGIVLNLLAVADRELGRFESAARKAAEAAGIHRNGHIQAHGQLPDDRRPAEQRADVHGGVAPSNDAGEALVAGFPPDADLADALMNLAIIALRRGRTSEAAQGLSQRTSARRT